MEPRTETRKRHAGMSVLLGRLMRRLSLSKRAEAAAPAWQPEASRFTLETLDPLILLSGDPITASVPLSYAATSALDLTVRVEEVAGVRSVRIVGSDNGEVVSKTKALVDMVGVDIVITGSAQNDTLHLDSSLQGAGLKVRFDAGEGSDSITGPGFDTRWTLSTTGKVQASQIGGAEFLSATGVESIVADPSASDTVVATLVQTWTATEPGILAIGGFSFANADRLQATQGSTLDFTAYQEAVKIDLGLGQASGFAGATGFTHLVGSAYGDYLIGDAQASRIDGGTGDDTIDGGTGLDTLAGGAGMAWVVVERDVSVTLTSTAVQVAGSQEDAISGFEYGRLVGGVGANRLDASGFAGAVWLEGGAGNDTLVGGAFDDTLTGGTGSDSLVGGSGIDLLLEQRDASMTLTATSISVGVETDSLAGIEQAVLTGGDGANRIDATTWSGALTVDGGSGNDTITGSAGNDVLTGGLGADSIDGQAGSDLLLEQTDTNFRLTGSAGTGSASAGSATLSRIGNQKLKLSLTGVTGGRYTITVEGKTTRELDWDAENGAIANALVTALGLTPDDLRVSVPVTGSYQGADGVGLATGSDRIIEFVGARAGQNYTSATLDSSLLTGMTGPALLTRTNATTEEDLVLRVEQVSLIGNADANRHAANRHANAVDADYHR